MPSSDNPSLYEMLTFNFNGELDLMLVDDRDQIILSVLDNIQRILNARAGTLSHIPDYGLPDMSQIIYGVSAPAHDLLKTIEATLLKYEPRLERIVIELQPSAVTGQLTYLLDAILKDIGLVRYDTVFSPEGQILVRHFKQQQVIST